VALPAGTRVPGTTAATLVPGMAHRAPGPRAAGAAEQTGKDLAQFQRPIALGFNRSYDCLDFSSGGEL
jgi:hypothetical protein